MPELEISWVSEKMRRAGRRGERAGRRAREREGEGASRREGATGGGREGSSQKGRRRSCTVPKIRFTVCTVFPEMKLRSLVPTSYIHVSVSE
jgi:hypothetical protein